MCGDRQCTPPWQQPRVLTLLGGGAFGNDTGWIIAAIHRAVHLYQQADLDVVLVSYGSPTPALQPLLHRTHHR